MILSLTYPKSGSHLVGFALGLGTTPTWQKSSTNNFEIFRGTSGTLRTVTNHRHHRGLWTHFPYTAQAVKCVMEKYDAFFFTRRDPRDVVVSIAHYVDKFPRGNLNYVRDGQHLDKWPLHDRIDYIIDIVATEMPMFLGWTIHPDVFQLRYEDLIENRERQFKRMNVYLKSRGVKPMDILQATERSHVKHKISYRRAMTGDWEYTFNDANKEHAQHALGGLMEALGYEWGENI